MNQFQPGILQLLPAQACYLTFKVSPKAGTQAVIDVLKLINIENSVVGIGQSLIDHLGKSINSIKSMPAQSANGITIPSTPVDLWCWLRGDDRGELLHRARHICQQLSPTFILKNTLDTFGTSFYSFKAQLNRMIGNEDGITGGLFEFSEVREGAYFWCPPPADNRLLLSSLED